MASFRFQIHPIFLILLFFAPLKEALAWTNPGFESGSLTGWTVSTTSGGAVVYAPHAVTVSPGAAPHTQGSLCPAPAVCLDQVHSGLFAAELDSGRGDNNHSDMARIEQSDVVPATGCLTFWFAAVLSGHHYLNGEGYGSDAYVQVDMIISGATVATQRYSWFDNAALLVDDGALPYGGPEPVVNNNPMQWKHLPWTRFYFNLSSYAGQTVTLRFSALSCDASGHGSWGYVDDVAWGACPTFTPTPTLTASSTFTLSSTPSVTRSFTYSPSSTLTSSPTSTLSGTVTATPSRTATLTSSPTPTLTVTPTLTSSPTSTFTRSPTSSLTATSTSTFSLSSTPSRTVTLTSTPTPSLTVTVTLTPSPTLTLTRSPTPSLTATATTTLSATLTASPSSTVTRTSTRTYSPTSSATPTFTATPTYSNTSSATPTFTWTLTQTPTSSPTRTMTLTLSATLTSSPSSTVTRTSTPTYSPSSSATPTFTASPTYSSSSSATPTFTWTLTQTPTSSPTRTVTMTLSATLTSSPSSTVTRTSTPTCSPTSSVTPTFTATPTYSSTSSATPTFTWTLTQTPTSSPTRTVTLTRSSTLTSSPSSTVTRTSTPTYSPTSSVTPTFTATPTYTDTSTATPTFTWTLTQTPTSSSTRTMTLTASPTPTSSPSFSSTSTASPSNSPSPTLTSTMTRTPTSTHTPTYTLTPTATSSFTSTPTFTVTPTFSDSPTFTATPTITMTFTPYIPNTMITLKIYNSAGEVVAVILDKLSTDQRPLGLQVSGDTLVPDQPGSKAILELVGTYGLDLSWNGINSNGQMVQSGSYSVMAEITDEFGRVTTYSAGVVVLRAPITLRASIYNSAGELVRTLQSPVGEIPGINDLTLSSQKLLIGGDSQQQLQVLSKDGSAWLSWDGRNDQGRLVSSGTYVIKLEAVQPGTITAIVTQSITVIHAPDPNPLSSAFAAPNPAGPGAASVLIHLGNVGQNQKVTAQFYNLAGELVASSDNGENSGIITWNLQSRNFSSGTYIVVLESKGGNPQLRRLKLVLKR